MSGTQFVLTLSCENRPGIVAAVSAYLFEGGCDIRDSQQFDDALSGRFFMRVAFDALAPAAEFAALRDGFRAVAGRFAMDWRMRDRRVRQRVLILVSRFDHCLIDLLYRHRIGELEMDVAGVVSNHPRDSFGHLDLGGAPFHHLPVERGAKLEQEGRLWRLIEDGGIDLVILARYMQVLSDGLAAELAGRCINIHHSFLPSFKGARPYHQAHARGVKLIGATSHYVTSELDEGPIIEQDVERISHRHAPDDLVRLGRDIERRVLARAVWLHLHDRVILSGSRTVVFAE